MASRSEQQAESRQDGATDPVALGPLVKAREKVASGDAAPIPEGEAGRGEARDDGADTLPMKISKTVAIYACVILVVFAYLLLSAPTCSSGNVDGTVMDIVETKLLHVKRFSASLSNIRVLQHSFFGDERCSADVLVDGKATSHKVEYHWTTHRGSLETVYAKLVS